MRVSLFAAALLTLTPVASWAAEQPVDPYVQSPANAGATPLTSDGTFQAFHGKAGIDRVVADTIARNVKDPRITDIFKNQDLERLQRTLAEQICYVLDGGCAYTGRDMKTAHKDMGIQASDMNALVENLQLAMDAEKVPFAAQNRLLAKLAPMRHDVVEQ